MAMKNTILKILKIIGAAYCGMIVLGGAVTFCSGASAESNVIVLIITIIFLMFTLLLIRSIRKGNLMKRSAGDTTQQNSHDRMISPYLPEVPAEVLRDMKRHYTAMQIQNDVRIMQESFQLVQQTTDFETFFSRLELARQKALTLLQAVQAGCKGIVDRKQTIRGCESVLSNTQAIKTVFLGNSYKKETAAALQLKTKAGQYKRLVTYMERLESYKDQFLDAETAYDKTISALQNLIDERRPEEKKSSSHSKSTSRGSSVDEIMKYKRLLDAGAITQEEYDAKKSQLLGL